MRFTPRSEAAHPRSRRGDRCFFADFPVSTLLCCAALALVLGSLPTAPATAAEAEPPTTADLEVAEDPNRTVRVPLYRLGNFDRLRRDLSTEATVEDLLEDGDRRDLTAVRAWVQRCNRVESCRLQDDPHRFRDGRDVLHSLAKESLREYVKQEIRWEERQDRMKVRVRNFFTGSRGGEPGGSGITGSSLPDTGAFEFSPQVDLDLEDTELGVDFTYAPARYRFLADWEVSYRENVQRRGRSLRLRYEGDDRWFDLTTAMDDRYLGNHVRFTVTQLF